MHQRTGNQIKARVEKLHLIPILFALFVSAFSPKASFAFPAYFGLSPDNSHGLLLSTLASAQKTLLINIYEFESHSVADAIIERIHAGVNVQILVEGQPAIPHHLTHESRRTLETILTAMKASHNTESRMFIMMGDKAHDIQRRFVYNHAKYVIADGEKSLISSENFSNHGHASPGTVGNRGWETVLEDTASAQRLTRLFWQDADRTLKDVREIKPGGHIPGISPPGGREPRPPVRRRIKSIGVGQGEVNSAELITAPNALAGIKDLIETAASTLEIEVMSLPFSWREAGHEAIQSPMVTLLIEAARRGVKVRALLNDETKFAGHDDSETEPTKNEVTARFLNDMARCNHLPLSAKIVDTDATGISYIHNKGLIVDERIAFVSSINGTRNSVINNREVAMKLNSPDAAKYFGHAFEFDWEESKPLGKKRAATSCKSLNMTQNLVGFTMPVLWQDLQETLAPTLK